MSFVHVSSLPTSLSDRDKVTSFQSDVDTIKKYLTEIGNTYLLVAYRVYEMSWSQNYKPWYKNISDACFAALGFKKSTTYNLINIVKRFGTPERDGYIPYSSLFGAQKFSYSQLCEMLSLSPKQCEDVTPDMTVKQIRDLKKTQPEQVSLDSFQTSGKNDFKGLVEIPDKLLLCCPRCGADCNTRLDFACNTYVFCSSCGLRSPSFEDRRKAFEFWNNQSYAGSVPELREELSKLKTQICALQEKLDCLY